MSRHKFFSRVSILSQHPTFGHNFVMKRAPYFLIASANCSSKLSMLLALTTAGFWKQNTWSEMTTLLVILCIIKHAHKLRTNNTILYSCEKKNGHGLMSRKSDETTLRTKWRDLYHTTTWIKDNFSASDCICRALRITVQKSRDSFQFFINLRAGSQAFLYHLQSCWTMFF